MRDKERVLTRQFSCDRALASVVLAGLAWTGLAACGEVSVPPATDGDPSGPVVDASLVDAAPRPDAAPPVCEDGVTQLLVNPGFEDATPAGAIGWTEESDAGDHLTYPEDQLGGFAVHEGNRAAWLGRAFEVDQRLSQRVTIPAGTTALSLSLFRCFATEEDQDEEIVFDTLDVSLLDASGAPIGAPLVSFSNVDAGTSCFWDDLERVIDDQHAGEEIQLELHAVTDGGKLTSFFFDTMALNATGPCPSATP